MQPCLAEATHSHTSHWSETRASAQSRAWRWPWQRIARCALLLSMITTDFQAHAGVHIQGVHIQGVHIQGTALHAGLQGEQLVLERARAGGTPVRIEVLSFRGDRVAVRVHEPSSGFVREDEIHPIMLAGATWSAESCDDQGACQEIRYRIANVTRDDSTNTMPAHPENHDVWLYEVEYAELAAATPLEWAPVCGEEGGVFVDGLWHADGAREDDGFTFSCPDGVIAKCVRGWGYKPWKTLPSEEHGDVSLTALHQMCTRAARADYCGDGNAHTREGTLIDIFDGYGFNVPDESAPFAAESGFGLSAAA